MGEGEEEPFQNIRFNHTIESVELENIPFTQLSELESGKSIHTAQPLSNLFTSMVLPKLKRLSFSNCSVDARDYMETPIDIHANFFSNQVEILFDGATYSYENILYRGGLGGGALTNIESHSRDKEVISTKAIKITPEIERRIVSFSQKFLISKELLSDYLQKLGQPDTLLEPFRKVIIQKADYSSYADGEGMPLKTFQAKRLLEKALDNFINELQEEVK